MGTTIFLPLDVPESGGDTLYLSTTAAYNALSPDFRDFLKGKHATHSGYSQAAVHDHRDRYIREPIETLHPIVRTHPVSNFISPSFSISPDLIRLPKPTHYMSTGYILAGYRGWRKKKVVCHQKPSLVMIKFLTWFSDGFELSIQPYRTWTGLAHPNPLVAWYRGGLW